MPSVRGVLWLAVHFKGDGIDYQKTYASGSRVGHRDVES